MSGFLVLSKMAYDVMSNEKLVVPITNIPFIPLYGVWNGAMHECNYRQRFYTMVHDTARHAA
jgi:predicted choloylglycine hydrolase